MGDRRNVLRRGGGAKMCVSAALVALVALGSRKLMGGSGPCLSSRTNKTRVNYFETARIGQKERTTWQDQELEWLMDF
jgi:hypothetical protein